MGLVRSLSSERPNGVLSRVVRTCLLFIRTFSSLGSTSSEANRTWIIKSQRENLILFMLKYSGCSGKKALTFSGEGAGVLDKPQGLGGGHRVITELFAGRGEDFTRDLAPRETHWQQSVTS